MVFGHHWLFDLTCQCAVKNCQVVIPDFGTVQGPFQIVSLEFAGEHNGEVTFNLALESAGELTFAAA